jgi:two-component system nitrogen regulation response regulator GlnG
MGALGSVLIVDDEPEICSNLSELLRREGLVPSIAYNGIQALQSIRLRVPDVLIVDLKMPDLDGVEVMQRAKALDDNLPVILITGYVDVRDAVEAMRAGAHDYLAKPFEHPQVIRVVLRALRERKLQRELRNLSNQLNRPASLREVFGPSNAVTTLIAEIDRVAKSDFTVVILGETGSGKEVVARAIHKASARAKSPFLPVDCGAIPEALLESELFGHEKGSFTGASAQQIGKFEGACGGTLFLDEISNMSLSSQAKILRVLQERSFFRIGGLKPIPVDIRLVTATNEDLHALAESGAFRRDLYFRLNEFTIRVPPLRERRQDIVYLAERFLNITCVELQKQVRGFTEDAVEVLLNYHWPGNVRQLRSATRRAVLLAEEVISEKELAPLRLSVPTSRSATMGHAAKKNWWAGLPLKEVVRRQTVTIERKVLAETLRQTSGNKAKAARLLQIDYKTLHNKVKEYHLAENRKE